VRGNRLIPTWVYLAVATLIAGVAFGIGQAFEGMGVPFVILATSLWTAYSVARQQKWNNDNG
jgi:drug/metabolite transporter (DMT)-like permease